MSVAYSISSSSFSSSSSSSSISTSPTFSPPPSPPSSHLFYTLLLISLSILLNSFSSSPSLLSHLPFLIYLSLYPPHLIPCIRPRCSGSWPSEAVAARQRGNSILRRNALSHLALNKALSKRYTHTHTHTLTHTFMHTQRRIPTPFFLILSSLLFLSYYRFFVFLFIILFTPHSHILITVLIMIITLTCLYLRTVPYRR